MRVIIGIVVVLLVFPAYLLATLWGIILAGPGIIVSEMARRKGRFKLAETFENFVLFPLRSLATITKWNEGNFPQ